MSTCAHSLCSTRWAGQPGHDWQRWEEEGSSPEPHPTYVGLSCTHLDPYPLEHPAVGGWRHRGSCCWWAAGAPKAIFRGRQKEPQISRRWGLPWAPHGTWVRALRNSWGGVGWPGPTLPADRPRLQLRRPCLAGRLHLQPPGPCPTDGLHLLQWPRPTNWPRLQLRGTFIRPPYLCEPLSDHVRGDLS